MFDADATFPAAIPAEALEQLSHGPRSCIQRLLSYFEANKGPYSLSVSRATSCEDGEVPINDTFLRPSQPLARLAAVLVLMYEQDGELRVLLTTRSKALRTHPGQTALPGGRVDAVDRDFVVTARREAQEEVDLPLDCPHIHVLGTLHPFVSLHRLLVTPVIALLTDPGILKDLKASEKEVAHIFSHPLEAILDPTLSQKESLVPIGSEDWPYTTEYYNTSDSVVALLMNTTYRMHRFRTTASPVKGLTAEILIKTAEIAYDKATVYGRYACGQLAYYADIIQALDASQSSTSLPDGAKFPQAYLE